MRRPSKRWAAIALAGAALVVSACEGASTASSKEPGDVSSPFLVFYSVPTGEGESYYAQALPSLATQEIDTARSIELEGYVSPWSRGWSTHVSSAISSTVNRFDVSRRLEIAAVSRMSTARYGTKALNANAFVSDERAFAFDLASAQVVEWDPTTTTLVAVHRLEGIFADDFVESRGGTETLNWATRFGDLVALEISYFGVDERPVDVLSVALFSTVERRVVAVARRSGCAAVTGASGGGLAPDGAYYLLGDGEWGRHESFDPSRAGACLLRILPGARDFDPSFEARAAKLTPGRRSPATNNRLAWDSALGGFIVWGRTDDAALTADTYIFDTQWTPFVYDPIANVARELAVPAGSFRGVPGWSVRARDGALYVFVPDQTGASGGDRLALWEDGQLTPALRVPSGFIYTLDPLGD